ncbi:hypothetical protein L1987_80903 [Smallanthus sonchifolius]|uniref:Uncharacterized protein n=1 Tax=Smallanthus sonchifolius TaxID=185202 RepID=A0ACB8YN85_9ASTR|nr:hypothetical protein L1987_80903 [Smallanthus sonchifolius]
MSPPEPNAATKTAGRKRTKDVSKTMNSCHIDAVKHNIGSNDNAKRESFKWTDESLCVMCDILNKHITSNGRNIPFKWADHQLEFEKVSYHKFNSVKAFRSKYDATKARYNLWKSLKDGETGLLWDESTGKLDCSDDWWEKKIKENPDFKRIRKKQPSRELQGAWDQLFANVVASAIDLNKSNHVNLEDEDGEATCFSNFIKEERREDGLPSNQGDGDGCQMGTKPEPILMESRLREAERAKMVKEVMTRQNVAQQSALKKVKTPSVNQVGDSSISACIGVISRMVDEGLMVSCSELWCFAVNLFEDDVKRELFMSLPDDVGRLAWLQYKQNLGI